MGMRCILGTHVLVMLVHGHFSLVRVHDVWFTMWAEHDLISGLWGFVSRWCSLHHCILYAHCIATGYVFGVREDRLERAYGLMVLDSGVESIDLRMHGRMR